MAEVADYVRNLAFFMIFTAFVETIAPTGSYKKYIRLLLSLILIAIVLEPFGIIADNPGFKNSWLRLDSAADNALNSRDREQYDRVSAELVLNEYKKRLEDGAKELIEARTGFSVDSINVVVNGEYESESFAEILGIHIEASIQLENNEQPRTKSVLLGNAASGAGSEAAGADASQKIKNCLLDFYNVPESNIHITVRDK